MANKQGSQGTGSTSGMKSDRDRDMTQQSGSGQHSQQNDRMDDANERVGGVGGSTQQSGSGSSRGQQSNSGSTSGPGSGASNPNPSRGNTGTSGGQYSGGSGGTGGNDR
jgi:hypothetical protein